MAMDASHIQFLALRRANLLVGLLHVAQAVLILALSNDFSLPVTGAFLDGPPGSAAAPQEHLLDVPVGPLVAVFLALAALDHLAVASPWFVAWYERNLRRERNKARWWEYAVSASIMVALIAMLAGISSVFALLALLAVNAAMIFFGLLMETVNPDRATANWTPYACGLFAGAVPWLIIAIAIGGAEADGSVPGFVYGIFISLFVLFNSFALNMALQYRRVGPWRDYLYGERAYILLSLTAKSLLAWQVFGSTLMD
jgi:hypothetical protein